MAVGLLVWIQLSVGWTRWLVTLGGVALGGIIYLAGVVILKVPEIKMIMNAITRRLFRGAMPSSQ